MFLSVFAKIRGGVAILNTKFNKSIGIWNLRRLLEIPIWFVANIVSTSLAGESFFSFFWQSPRDDVLVKIRVSITVLGWCQEGHLVSHKILPHLNLWNGKNYWLTELRKWDWIFFWSEVAAHGRTSVRCRPSQTLIQRLYHPENEFVDMRVCSVNVRTLRLRSG